MNNIKQPIACRANPEDGCTGYLFEGCFFSGALLDVHAVGKGLAYIDLNPIRAGVARSLEGCAVTAMAERSERAASTRSPRDRVFGGDVQRLARRSAKANGWRYLLHAD